MIKIIEGTFQHWNTFYNITLIWILFKWFWKRGVILVKLFVFILYWPVACHIILREGRTRLLQMVCCIIEWQIFKWQMSFEYLRPKNAECCNMLTKYYYYYLVNRSTTAKVHAGNTWNPNWASGGSLSTCKDFSWIPAKAGGKERKRITT